jgi:hypothetical protein
MIHLLTEQDEANLAFRHWADAMLDGGLPIDRGWRVEGTGVAFSNYGHGAPGTIDNEIMLGTDQGVRDGVVKIVRPKVSQTDKGKLTVIGRSDDGRLLLMREGWLKANRISDVVRPRFKALSGLEPERVSVGGRASERDWYIVADLDADSADIVAQTVSFVHACARARAKTGVKGTPAKQEEASYRLGLDEKGRIKKVKVTGATHEVEDLQGYVWEELKRQLGEAFQKPGRKGYAADGMLVAANLLIEIKTGVSPRDVYEAVGQLALYPSLIALPAGLDPVLLVPEVPSLRPQLAAALNTVEVEVQFYSVGRVGAQPSITFPAAFLARCRQTVTSAGKRRAGPTRAIKHSGRA